MQTDNGLSIETNRIFVDSRNFWVLSRMKISYDPVKFGRMVRQYGRLIQPKIHMTKGVK